MEIGRRRLEGGAGRKLEDGEDGVNGFNTKERRRTETHGEIRVDSSFSRLLASREARWGRFEEPGSRALFAFQRVLAIPVPRIDPTPAYGRSASSLQRDWWPFMCLA